MNLASSTKHVLLVLGLGVISAACGDPEPTPATTYTWTQVSTDMKNSCAAAASCHLKGTTQPFSYDKALTAGSDKANYDLLTTANLINKTTPSSSTLLVVGAGGMYMGSNHTGTNLSPTQLANWTAWVTAGATYP